jgi:hypothetical protein
LNCEEADLILFKAIVIVACKELKKISLEKLEDDALGRVKSTMCLRKMVKSLILTIPLSPALSFWLMCVRMEISTKVCGTNYGDFFTIFNAKNYLFL